jgi:hypothetical protein
MRLDRNIKLGDEDFGFSGDVWQSVSASCSFGLALHWGNWVLHPFLLCLFCFGRSRFMLMIPGLADSRKLTARASVHYRPCAGSGRLADRVNKRFPLF